MFASNIPDEVSGVGVGGRAAREAGVMAITLAPPPSSSAHPLERSTAFCSTTVCCLPIPTAAFNDDNAN